MASDVHKSASMLPFYTDSLQAKGVNNLPAHLRLKLSKHSRGTGSGIDEERVTLVLKISIL